MVLEDPKGFLMEGSEGREGREGSEDGTELKRSVVRRLIILNESILVR
jgi:hypothetical protein